MSTASDGAVLRQLQLLFNLGTVANLTDGQLLERFATRRDESSDAAFAAIMERHGPMVQRVCRSILIDPEDAQDAFQATFLVLIRRAHELWVHDSLGPWLHRVALRTSQDARTRAARRRRLDRLSAVSEIAVEPDRAYSDLDLLRGLHEELGRLPDRYRAPVVLCDLEGQTHEQAARSLGWPVGTVKSRLTRARERLRSRLRGQGLDPNAAVMGLSVRSASLDFSLSPCFIRQTTSAAIRFASVGSASQGAAASLAQGVLSTMAIAKWAVIGSVLLVIGMAASGVRLLAQNREETPGQPPEIGTARPESNDVGLAFTAHNGPLTVTVAERGRVEARQGNSVYSEVEGQTTILSIVPEGSAVKKGQLVCELDSSSLQDQRVNQQSAVQKAEAEFQNAHRASEVAEIALVEYTEGLSNNELARLNAEIKLAEANFARGHRRLTRTQQTRQKVDEYLRKAETLSAAELVADLDLSERLDNAELAINRESLALEMYQNRKKIYEQFTRPKITKQLQIELERCRSEEQKKRDALELEKSKLDKLSQQLNRCKLVAPSDGLVVYATDPNLPVGSSRTAIEPNATVRERQLIFRIYDPKEPAQINAKIPETKVELVQPGLKVEVRVDAFPDRVFDGKVKSVAPLPDPHGFFVPAPPKVYTTFIELDQPRQELRPGMTADLEILVDRRDNVLSVPVSAVISQRGRTLVAVKKKNAKTYETRDVTLGITNDAYVEITRGLDPGDQVAVNPRNSMSAEDLRRLFGEPIRPTQPAGSDPESTKPRGN
jgi:RND family efflux transporter MFP subunit